MPWALVISASAWMLIAVLSLTGWAGLRPEAGVDADTADTLSAQGVPTVDSGPAYPPFLLVLVAVLLALAGACLALRLGLARYPAVVLGVVSVVLLAVGARWETVPAMLLLVVGTVPLVTPAAVRQLR